MRTAAILTLATSTVLAGLATAGATAQTVGQGSDPEPTTTTEKGIVLECTGHVRSLGAYVNLYENPELNYVQVVINGDPELTGSREPDDIWQDDEIRTGVRVDGHRARVVGSAEVVGRKRPVHEEFDDHGYHYEIEGVHRRLAHDLALRHGGARVPLDCDPAFFYRLTTTVTPLE